MRPPALREHRAARNEAARRGRPAGPAPGGSAPAAARPAPASPMNSISISRSLELDRVGDGQPELPEGPERLELGAGPLPGEQLLAELGAPGHGPHLAAAADPAALEVAGVAVEQPVVAGAVALGRQQAVRAGWSGPVGDPPADDVDVGLLAGLEDAEVGLDGAERGDDPVGSGLRPVGGAVPGRPALALGRRVGEAVKRELRVLLKSVQRKTPRCEGCGRGRGPGQSWTSRASSESVATAVCRAARPSVTAHPGRAPPLFSGWWDSHAVALSPPVTTRHTREQVLSPTRRRRTPMSRLQQTDGLTEDQAEILKPVREFVDEQILPVATELEHADEYPTEIVEGMKELGIFGLMIPEEYGGLGESLLTYALVRRGDRPRLDERVSGIINTHFIVAYMLLQHGTEEQKQQLPAADGDRRGARRVLDVRARAAAPTSRRSRPRPSSATTASYVDHRPEDVADQRRLVQPGRGAGQDRRGRRLGLQEHDDLPGREGAGLRRDRARASPSPARSRRWATRASTPPSWSSRATGSPPTRSSAASPGKGFYQMMDGVEVGRVNVAARGCGVANRAFELGIAYAQQRETFGKKIAEHQAVLFRLAEMATKVEAAHQMMVKAARKKDSGRAQRPRGRDGEVPRLASTATRSSRTPSASTAATATPRSTRSSGSTARRRCCSSARAPPTSRG